MELINIITGFVNLTTTEPNEEQLEKLKICSTCPFNVNKCCTKCGCYIPAKVRSNSKCPLKKF